MTIVALLLIVTVSSLAPLHSTRAQATCCVTRGNVDGDPGGLVNISDLTYLVAMLFQGGPPAACAEEANVDADPDGLANISDLTYLVGMLFQGFDDPPACLVELSLTEREIVFTAVDSAMDANNALPPASLANALVAYLLTRPEIEEAEVIDSISVWARFTDGRMLLIPNNLEPDGGGGPIEPGAENIEIAPEPVDFVIPPRRFPDWDGYSQIPSVRNAPAAPSAFDYDLPQSIAAHLMSSVSSTCFTQSVPQVKSLLDNHGYLTTVYSGSVASLFSIDGAGVFYFYGHGGLGIDKARNRFMGLWTSTRPDSATEATYATLLRRDELVYMLGKDFNPDSGGCAKVLHYGFTGKFIAQYMYFAPNSIVFINACQGDSVAALRNAFFTAGASVFCGWSKTVSVPAARKAVEFMFDRLLGANASTLTPVESPHQRPFDIDRVWQDMQNRGFDTDPSNGSKLRVRRLQNHFGVLAPSIRYMFPIEHTDSFYITGIFGNDPGSAGRVIVGGTELPILDWTPEMITCFIPNTGAGSAGPVWVEIDGQTGPSYSVKRKSNVVNLTEWRGTFTFTHEDAGTLKATITIDAHLRADIHTFRETPHTAPAPYAIIFSAAEDSYGAVEATGQFSYTWPDSDPTSIDTWSWDGSDFVKGPWEPYSNQYAITGQVNFATHKLQMMFTAYATSGLSETLVNNLDGFQWTDPLITGTTSETIGMYDAYPYNFIDMSDAWEILTGQRMLQTCCSHDPDNPGDVNDVTYKLSWPTILPYFPPDTTEAQ